MAPTNRNAAKIMTTWNGRATLMVCLPSTMYQPQPYRETRPSRSAKYDSRRHARTACGKTIARQALACGEAARSKPRCAASIRKDRRLMEHFATARDAAHELRPDVPVYCFRPNVLTADARTFANAFPGRTAYAVKTNGEPIVLETLTAAGIDCFDVASPGEFAAVRAVAPHAEMLYMHPVKAQSDIRLALETYRIRAMALDHEDEVAKILRIVRGLDLDPKDITLYVRLAARGSAAYELSKKFGAAPAHAVELIQRIANVGFKVGLCFHVGSQMEDAGTYERALATAAWVRGRSSVPIVALDIGGGFPAAYGSDPRLGALVGAGVLHLAADME